MSELSERSPQWSGIVKWALDLSFRIQTWAPQSRLTQKYAFIKKSTIFTQSVGEVPMSKSCHYLIPVETATFY